MQTVVGYAYSKKSLWLLYDGDGSLGKREILIKELEHKIYSPKKVMYPKESIKAMQKSVAIYDDNSWNCFFVGGNIIIITCVLYRLFGG